MAANARSIPHLDLTSDLKTLERESEEWKAVSERVCEALETFGCMTVEFNKIQQEEMLRAMRSFFALPVETKRQHRPFIKSYVGTDETGTFLQFENVGVGNATRPDKAKDFTDTMWPQGNQAFCETLNTTSKKMMELAKIVMNMIYDRFGLEMNDESPVLSEKAEVQMIRYVAPMKDEVVTGVSEHVDGSLLSVLFQNEVDGLHVKSRHGEWHEVKLGGSSLIIFAGHILTAWSNGKFHAPLHKVEMGGYKERLSGVLFWTLEDDKIIHAHPGFINKQNPPLFKPFTYGEFSKHLRETRSLANSLDLYASLDNAADA